MTNGYRRELESRTEVQIKRAGVPASVGSAVLIVALLILTPQTPPRFAVEVALLCLSLYRVYHCRRSFASSGRILGFEVHGYACLVTLASFAWAYVLIDLNRVNEGDPRQNIYVLLIAIGLCSAGASSLALMARTYLIMLFMIMVVPALAMLTGPVGPVIWPATPYCLLAYALFLVQQAREFGRTQIELIRADIRSAGERDHLTTVLNGLPMLVLCVDREAKCVLVNQGVLALYDRPRTDFDYRPVESLPITPALATCIATFLASPLERDAVELALAGPSGARRYLISMRKLDDPVVHAIFSAEDVEDARDAQSTVLHHQAELQHSAKMAALGAMAGGIAHEINNPLAIISGKVQMMRRNLAEDPASVARLDLGFAVIEQTVDRIAKIIRGMRQISRDGTQDRFEVRSLFSIVEDSLPLVESLLRTSRIELVTDDISPELTVSCRAVEIAQILVNLIANSCDAISAEPEPRWINVSVRKVDRWIVLSVTDSGHGIIEPLRHKIMQPFFTTKDVGKGTGIGLSISRGIAQAHGGNLELDETCANTRFNVYLPAPDAAPA